MMADKKPGHPSDRGGYPEEQPKTNRKGKHVPDADTPHEPQNDPEQKPKPSS